MKNWKSQKYLLALASVFTLSATASTYADILEKYSPKIGTQIGQVLAMAPSMNIDKMEPLHITKHVLPEPAIDLMRVRLEETYSIDGIGKETVQLSGYMAVVHGKPAALDTSKPLSWQNSVISTEFVALELTGESRLFGTIKVSLDQDRPSVGRVGSFNEAPMDFLIQAGLSADDVEGIGPPSGDCAVLADGTTSPACGDCYAPLSVSVAMEDLDLKMTTDAPILMYSYVETIPPIGVTASVSASGRTLIHDGRPVGVLKSAQVKFRELVYSRRLDGELLDKRFQFSVAQK